MLIASISAGDDDIGDVIGPVDVPAIRHPVRADDRAAGDEEAPRAGRDVDGVVLAGVHLRAEAVERGGVQAQPVTCRVSPRRSVSIDTRAVR